MFVVDHDLHSTSLQHMSVIKTGPKFPQKKTTKCFILVGNCWICGVQKFQEGFGFGVSRRWELRSWEINIDDNKYISIIDKTI